MNAIWRIRAAILVLVGVLVIHKARFFLVPPEHEHDFATAHAYLTWLWPLAGATLFVAVAELVARLGRQGDRSGSELPSVRTMWAAAAFCLFTIFTAQESVEAVSAGHPLPTFSGLISEVWVAAPLALIVGGLIALLLKGAAVAVRRALFREVPRVPCELAAPRIPRAPALAPYGSVLAQQMAGRAPPILI
jgi:hypothetical protein